jgi:uncharacterized protein YuzE
LKTTSYFEQSLRERPEIRRDWCERAVREPLEVRRQGNGWFQQWAYIVEAGKYLGVITLEDGEDTAQCFLRSRIRETPMRYFYDAEHDSLFIHLRDAEYHESQEIAPGFVVDFDSKGVPMALDISQASRNVDVAGLQRGNERPFEADIVARR